MATMGFPPFHPRSGDIPFLLSEQEFAQAFPRESDLVEWKEGAGQDAIQRAVVAFSNSNGGVILIGVDDSGRVVGRDPDGASRVVHQAVATCYEPGTYWIHVLLVGDKRVTVVAVAQRTQGFAQTSKGELLVRRGASNRALLGGELQRFISSRAFARFDLTETTTPWSDASQPLIRQIAESYGWVNMDPRRFIDEELAADGPDGPVLTVAGALTLLPDPSAVISKSFVEVLRFPNEGSEYDRRLEIRGSVQEVVVSTTDFLVEELGIDVVVTGVRRLELPRLPTVVIREALANAVAHRSYEDVGRPIQVEIFPSRLIVTSPGGLVEPVTEENIRDAHSSRNAKLLQVLRRLRLAEELGRGVDVIQDTMAEALLDPPSFRDRGHSVVVELPIRGAVTPQEKAWVREVERSGEIRPSDRLLLVQAARGEVLTNKRVREVLAVDRGEAVAALHRLRDAGFLRQSGTRGGTSYVLGESVASPPWFRMTPTDLRELVVDLAASGPITNADVRQATGLDRVAALRVLDALVREGLLRRHGERRTTRYELASPPTT
ncbi:MAG: ATP-binding protein [Actinomycetota bacterium]